MSALLVTGYIETNCAHRDKARYLELGHRLLNIGLPAIAFMDGGVDINASSSTTIVPTSLSSCWLYANTRTSLSPIKNSPKDTVDYMVVIQQKTAWLKEVAERYACKVVVWIDFGILHLNGVTENHINSFFDCIESSAIKKISAPSIWPLTASSIVDYSKPAWYFAGGIIVAPRELAQWFHEEASDVTNRYLRKTNMTTWEVNSWAEVARKNMDRFMFWSANHDLRLFVNYPNYKYSQIAVMNGYEDRPFTQNKSMESTDNFRKLNGPRLCLSMIVKDEAGIIERALRSVAQIIECCVICDTGSNDDTIRVVEEFCKTRNIPCEIHNFPFYNFSQARNEALSRARNSSYGFDYILLMDADMELVLKDSWEVELNHADAFFVTQRSVNLSYENIRLIKRSAVAHYVGATHEALVIEGTTTKLGGIYFIDYTDGANRSDKLARDEKLLLEELDKNPDNLRTIYYLAQTLRDAGRYTEAVNLYARRFAAGGWEEERWHARYQQALCDQQLGNTSAFIEGCLIAYSYRPQRAEPLHSLIRYYTDAGLHDVALLLAEQVSKIAWPKMDRLFIEAAAYDDVHRKISSVSGFYSAIPERRDLGRSSCESLAIDPQVTVDTRWRARQNLVYYAVPIDKQFPDSQLYKLSIELPEPFVPTNPSFTRYREGYVGVIRGVNYRISAGKYSIIDKTGTVRTRNFFTVLDADFSLISIKEIHDSHCLPLYKYSRILGFEDCRLFNWNDGWWCSATSRETNETGLATMVLLQLDEHFDVCNAFPLRGFADDQHQKNWMPFVDDKLKFIYSCSPRVLIDATLGNGSFTVESIVDPGAALDHWRGGGQLVSWKNGYISIVHEAIDTLSGREYVHRFVVFDERIIPVEATQTFYFIGRGIEFASGLTTAADNYSLLVSFGISDCEAWVAKVPIKSIQGALRKIQEYLA